MARVYSTRFLLAAGAGQYKAYYVPAARRAVVKTVIITNFDSATQDGYVRVAGSTVGYWRIPGATGIERNDTMLVAYAGEAVELGTSGPSMNGIVCGYLLEDLVGREDGGLLPALEAM